MVIPNRLERRDQACTFSKGKTWQYLRSIHHLVRIQTSKQEILISLCSLASELSLVSEQPRLTAAGL